MKILITGASAGIGKACVELLAKDHQLLIASRRIEVLETIKKSTGSENIICASLDVSDEEAINQFCIQNKAWLNDVDVLVNNAGLALGRESFEDHPSEDINTVIKTNVLGLIHLTHKLLPFMIKNKKGHIINLGSVAASMTYTGGSIYCSSKAAVHMFSDGLRLDLGGKNIKVSVVAPARVETDFSVVRYRGDKKAADKVYQGYRPLKSEDIAKTIEWMIQQPEHVNIQDLTISSVDQPNCVTINPFKG